MKLVDFLKNNPHKTHLIFDFDDTIFKLLLPWEICLIYSEEGLKKMDPNLLEKYYKGEIHLNDLQNEYVLKFDDKAWKLFYEGNVKFETGCYKGAIINYELKEFIEKNNKYELFIWSSNTFEVIEKVLKEHKLLNKFKKIYTRSNLKFLKPHIEAFEQIYDPKIPKENYLFIGDSKSDEMAAKNAGIEYFKVPVIQE